MLCWVHHTHFLRSQRDQREGEQEDDCMRTYHKGAGAIRVWWLRTGYRGGCQRTQGAIEGTYHPQPSQLYKYLLDIRVERKRQTSSSKAERRPRNSLLSNRQLSKKQPHDMDERSSSLLYGGGVVLAFWKFGCIGWAGWRSRVVFLHWAVVY